MFIDNVLRHKKEQSLRQFAAALSENLDIPISHGTVANWLGKRHRPDIMVLLRLQTAYPPDDWRHQIAKSGMDEYYRVV